MKRIGAALLAIGVWAGMAVAADKKMDEIVVTASRIPVARDKIGSQMSVITSEEIESKKLRTVQDVLRQVPGIYVLRFGGPGKSTTVKMRGAESTGVMILFDGMPLLSNTTGSTELNHLSTDNIERIEIVKGSQSTLYGSSAMGGVINIITKKGAKKAEFVNSAEYGTWHSSRISSSYRGMIKSIGYSLTASIDKTDGISATNEYNGGNGENDGAEAKNVAMGVTFPGYFDVDLKVRYEDGVTATDNFGVDTDQQWSWQDYLVTGVTLTRKITDHWDLQLKSSYSYDHLFGRWWRQPTATSNFKINSFTRQQDIQNTYRHRNHTATIGWARERMQGTNFERNPPFSKTYVTRAWYAQDMVAYKDWTFLIGGRYEEIDSDSGGIEEVRRVPRTYRFTAARPIGEEMRFHGSLGTGFRKPTINETTFPTNFSNPNLKPEESKTWDLGVEYIASDDHFQMDVTYFNVLFTDLIATSATGNKSQNFSKATNKGIEIEGRYTLTPKLLLSFSGTWQHSDIQDTATPKKELRRTPRKQAAATLRYAFTDKFEFIGNVNFIGASWDNATNTTPLSQSAITNLVFNYKPDDNNEWSLRVNNAFNEVRYEASPPSYNPVLRNIFLTWTNRL